MSQRGRLGARRIHRRSAPADGYGASVAIDATRAVIGAPQADGGNGAVRAYEEISGDWMPDGVLTASGLAAGDGPVPADLSRDSAMSQRPGIRARTSTRRRLRAGAWRRGVGAATELVALPNGAAQSAVRERGGDRARGRRAGCARGSAPGQVALHRRVAGVWQPAPDATLHEGRAGDRFGAAFALASDRLAVGVPRHAGACPTPTVRRCGDLYETGLERPDALFADGFGDCPADAGCN